MDLKKRADEMKKFFNSKIDGYDERHIKIIKGKERELHILLQVKTIKSVL